MSSAALDRPAAQDVLERVNPLSHPGWNDLVLQHVGCSVFHTVEWAKVLNASYGHSPVYLLQQQQGRGQSIFPIMELSSALKGRRGVSLPFTDCCDPLLNGKSFLEMFARAIEIGKARQWRYVESRVESEQAAAGEPALEFFSHSLDVSRPMDALFAAANSTLRNEIRKCEKSGVEVVLATDDFSLRCYYEMHCLTRKKHGLPPQPYKFFQNIHEHLISKGAGFITLAFITDRKDAGANRLPMLCSNSAEALGGRRPVAGAIFLHFGKRAVYKFSASDESRNRLPAGKLALWRAIQWYNSQGFHRLDFGRTSADNTGLRRYKQAWGTRESRVRNLTYDLRSNRFVATEDKVYGWYNVCFRLAPSFLSRWMGSLLYPHLQ